MNIFLLRGLVRERKHWDWFQAYLKSAFPNANIILLEIPGVGESYQTTSPDNFIDMIKFMREKSQSYIDDDNENVLIAMSLGGMIARVWLDKFNKDFNKLILINTSFKGITPLLERLRPLSILRFIKIFFTPSVRSRERQILEMVSNNKTEREKLLDGWVQIQEQRPVKRKSFINQIKAALTSKVDISVPKDIKILILAGKEDKLCNYKSSIRLNKAWGGEIELHQTAGHDLPIDDPTWLVETIKKWINK